MPGVSPAVFESLLRDLVAATFRINVSRETRETDVWILAKTDTRPAALVESAGTRGSSWIAGPGSLKVTNNRVWCLAMALEGVVGQPVLDETGIDGNYNIQPRWDPADPQAALEAVRRLGFRIEKSRRPIEVLVVTKAE